MRLGIILPQIGAGAADVLRAARMAEDSGLDSIWTYDRLWGVPDPRRSVLESWTTLAAVAASTDRLTVGTLVSRTTLRNRRVLLAMAESVAMIAPGRLIVGIGVGDSQSRDEMAAYGLDYPPLGARLDDLEAHLDLFATRLPEVPVWIGGGSRGVMSLLPKANGWNYWGTVEGFIRRAPAMRSAGGDRELSWGGSGPADGQLERLAAAGADHAVVAVGLGNYRDRIRMLGALAGALRGSGPGRSRSS